MGDVIKKAIKDASYLTRNGWKWERQEGEWGYTDPKTKEHYLAKDALLIQLIRDSKEHKRFAREPLPYC